MGDAGVPSRLKFKTLDTKTQQSLTTENQGLFARVSNLAVAACPPLRRTRGMVGTSGMVGTVTARCAESGYFASARGQGYAHRAITEMWFSSRQRPINLSILTSPLWSFPQNRRVSSRLAQPGFHSHFRFQNGDLPEIFSKRPFSRVLRFVSYKSIRTYWTAKENSTLSRSSSILHRSPLFPASHRCRLAGS